MGAFGETAHGGAVFGELGVVLVISPPVTTLELLSARREAGPHGEGAFGEAVFGDGTYLDQPTVTGVGTVTAAAPVTTLALSDVEPSLAYVIAAEATQLTLDEPEAAVTGVGTVTAAAPVTVLSLSDDGQDIGYLYWAIDDQPIGDHTEETRDWQTLGLVFRVGSDTVDAHLSQLQDTAEKQEIVLASDGSFSALDRAATDGVYELRPPVGRTPPREIRDYVVGRYADRSLDRADVEHEVSVDFVAVSDREPDGSATDETRASDEWAFDFRSAQIATDRVEVDWDQGTDTGADTVSLRLILDAEQTKALEESATRLAAVSVREVADGANTVDDDSDGPTDANTVDVTTPDGKSPIREGEWVVMDWSTEWLSDRSYRVDLTLGRP